MLTQEEVQILKNLRQYAEKNVVSYVRVLRMKDGKEGPVGDQKEHVAHAGGFRVVYSIEDQSLNGLIRHASFTGGLTTETTYTLKEILEHLGFVAESKDRKSTSWVEHDTPFGNAFNLLQEIPDGNELLHKAPANEQVLTLPEGGSF